MYSCCSSTDLHESCHPMRGKIDTSLATPQSPSPALAFWQGTLQDLFESMKLGQPVACTFGMEKLAVVSAPHPSDTCHFRTLVAAGKAFYSHGDFESSMTYYREALRIKKDTINEEPVSVQALFADVLDDIAFLQSQRDPVKSIQAYHLCIEIRRNCLSSSHPLLGKTLYMLASVYFVLGMGSEALDLLLQALLVLEDDSEDSRAFDLWMAIGTVQRHLGNREDSDSSFEEAARILLRLRTAVHGLDLVKMMARLSRCRGNRCITPDDLNEAIAFFGAVMEVEEDSSVDGEIATALPA
jgi:tetratricopeptide (TPR) repeat protein